MIRDIERSGPPASIVATVYVCARARARVYVYTGLRVCESPYTIYTTLSCRGVTPGDLLAGAKDVPSGCTVACILFVHFVHTVKAREANRSRSKVEHVPSAGWTSISIR